MKIKIYKDLNNTLLKDWRNLWKMHPYANIVNSPEWFMAACKSYNYKEKSILALYKNSKLIAIAGFVKSSLFGIPFFIIPAEKFAHEQPLLVDYVNSEITCMFFNELIKLGNIYIKSFDKEIISRLDKHQKNINIFSGEIHSYVSFLDGEYGSFSKDNKKQIFNRLRKLKERVFTEIKEANHEDLLKHAFQIEIKSSKGEKGIGVFNKENSQEFYSSLARFIPKNLITAILYFGKKPVAYSIGFMRGDNYISSQKAHLSQFNYYMPGKLIKLHLMHYWRSKHNAGEFDFGPGYDRFKKDFTKRIYQTYNIIFSKNKLIRIYSSYSYEYQMKVYKVISKNKRIYSAYKRVINTLRMAK